MWITNDKQAAKALRRADKTLATAREKARDITPLAAKVEALRAAKQMHAAKYAAIAKGFEIIENDRTAGNVNVINMATGYCFGGFHGVSKEYAAEIIAQRATA
jgi:hypothetical protein